MYLFVLYLAGVSSAGVIQQGSVRRSICLPPLTYVGWGTVTHCVIMRHQKRCLHSDCGLCGRGAPSNIPARRTGWRGNSERERKGPPWSWGRVEREYHSRNPCVIVRGDRKGHVGIDGRAPPPPPPRVVEPAARCGSGACSLLVWPRPVLQCRPGVGGGCTREFHSRNPCVIGRAD